MEFKLHKCIHINVSTFFINEGQGQNVRCPKYDWYFNWKPIIRAWNLCNIEFSVLIRNREIDILVNQNMGRVKEHLLYQIAVTLIVIDVGRNTFLFIAFMADCKCTKVHWTIRCSCQLLCWFDMEWMKEWTNESCQYWKLFKRSSVLRFWCALHLKSITSTSVYVFFVTVFKCQLSYNDPQSFHCLCPNWSLLWISYIGTQPSVSLTLQFFFSFLLQN